MGYKWEHSRRCSRLYRDDSVLGLVSRNRQSPIWAAYSDLRRAPNWGILGTFTNRAKAMRAVASATDPRKGHFLG